MRLQDRVVVVTGASSGIGAATALVLASEGLESRWLRVTMSAFT